MTAAVVAAGLSNWIPFFDFGPSEAITIAAAVELSTSVAEESITLTTLTTAKTTLEEATLEYELATAEETTLARGRWREPCSGMYDVDKKAAAKLTAEKAAAKLAHITKVGIALF